MMKLTLILAALLACSINANAGVFTSTETRAEAIKAQLEGNNNYHAHLARELASIAEVEKDQHDVAVAQEFMRMAEEHAAQAGGK